MPTVEDLRKPIPPVYDYATFRYYLELDVLQDTAKFLEWVDINAEVGGTSRTVLITGTTAVGSNIITLDEPTPFPFIGGTIFEGTADDYTTLGPTPKDATEVLIDADAAVAEDATYTFVQENIPYRNAQSIYDAITDEVVLKMGYTNPLQVPSDKIREMMLIGRMEAWRAVARNTVSDIDFIFEDKVLTRSVFHKNALKQWNLANHDYNKEFGTVSYANYTTPAVRTYSGKVVGRW